MSKFWKALMKLTGIKHKMSTAYHPQTDRASEWTNKTVIQALRFHVEHNQSGWARALLKVWFDIMNTPNASTAYSAFILKTGRSLRLIPPWMGTTETAEEEPYTLAVKELVQWMELMTEEARDMMLAANILQAHHVNAHRGPEPGFQVGDKVMLTMGHWGCEYMQAKSGQVAKFMPRFDGPYEITEAFPMMSDYRLALPATSKAINTFHVLHLCPFVANDDELFPSRTLAKPGLVVTAEESTEFFIEKILDGQPWGRGKQYLVQWFGYGPEHDLWLPCSELLDMEALAKYEEWES